DAALDFLGEDAGIFFLGKARLALGHAVHDGGHFFLGSAAFITAGAGFSGELVEEVLVVELFGSVGADHVGELGAGGFLFGGFLDLGGLFLELGFFGIRGGILQRLAGGGGLGIDNVLHGFDEFELSDGGEERRFSAGAAA